MLFDTKLGYLKEKTEQTTSDEYYLFEGTYFEHLDQVLLPETLLSK